MYVDLPEFKRCCVCIPLRYGLLAWGYFKLEARNTWRHFDHLVDFKYFFLYAGFLTIFSFIEIHIITILLMVFLTAIFIAEHNNSWVIFIVSLLFVAGAMEISFNIVFVVGAHRKNQKLLKVYFYYSVVGIILFSILSLVNLGLDIFMFLSIYRYHEGSLYTFLLSGVTVTSFLQILLEYYLILLVRSEIRKLDNGHELEFVNVAAEAVCKLKADKEMTLPESIETMD